jgi:hypothetical protein
MEERMKLSCTILKTSLLCSKPTSFWTLILRKNNLSWDLDTEFIKRVILGPIWLRNIPKNWAKVRAKVKTWLCIKFRRELRAELLTKKEFIQIWTFIVLLPTRNVAFQSNYSHQFSLSLELLDGVLIFLNNAPTTNLLDQPQIILGPKKNLLLQFKIEKIMVQLQNFD